MGGLAEQIIRSVGGGGAHYGRIVDLAHVRATVHRLVWGRVAWIGVFSGGGIIG